MASSSFPVIKSVKAFTLQSDTETATGGGGADCHDEQDNHWINGHPTPIDNPMSIYSKYATTRKSWGINALGTMVVRVEDNEGNVGFGVSIGGEPGQAFISMSQIVECIYCTLVELC